MGLGNRGQHERVPEGLRPVQPEQLLPIIPALLPVIPGPSAKLRRSLTRNPCRVFQIASRMTHRGMDPGSSPG